MSGRFARSLVLALVLCLLVPVVRAETLPLPDNLTDLNSNQGEAFFLETDALANYSPIADNFVTPPGANIAGWSFLSVLWNDQRRFADPMASKLSSDRGPAKRSR